jgi:hypothetical protein
LDAETKNAIRELATAIDSVSGMAAGIAAYVATLEGASFVDRRKAVGLSHSLVPESLSGDEMVTPGRVAQAMIEQIGVMARDLYDLKNRIERPAPRIEIDPDAKKPRLRTLAQLQKPLAALSAKRSR